MEKIEYIVPTMDVLVFNTSELMKTGGSSPGLPPGPGTSAPRRRTEVF